MLDKKITGGTIVDGTGRTGFSGDIGIRDGRIAAIGTVEEPALEAVDARGFVIAPGFIDCHTHYDAQAFWEPTFSPSCYHGVTTIVGGFCGFSIAPLTPDAAPYLKRMLARVEGMPVRALEAGVPWDWSSFGSFLSRLDGKVGLNAGFFVGHSAIRRVVMGKRAVGEKATADELERMKVLLDDSLRQGALGFSTTQLPGHNDGEGNAVPSRWADRDELIDLARVVSKHEGTGLEFLPDIEFGPGVAELLTDFSLAGNRPVNWNVVIVNGRAEDAERAEHQLRATDYARERGGEVIALTVPNTSEAYLNLRTGFVFDSLPGLWREIFKLSLQERIERLKEPAVRRQLWADAATVRPGVFLKGLSELDNYTVVSTRVGRNKKYEGRIIKEIAVEEGRAPQDVLFDIAVDDSLEAVFSPTVGGYDQASFELRAKLWADDRTMIGASDAGAHLDMIDSFAFSTFLLQKGVREHKVISLEQAIHKITQRPAVYFGLVERGLIAKGFHADLVVFDPGTVARGPTYQRYDLPGCSDFRLYADAVGVGHVFVNGVEIVRHGRHTGQLPGKVLRSGKDTKTTPMGALRVSSSSIASTAEAAYRQQ